MTQQARRRIVVQGIDIANVREIEIPSDSRLFSIVKSEEASRASLVMACPENSASVKRFVWMIPVGMEIPVAAQEGQFLGCLENIEGSVPVVVFAEEQEAAIVRSQHRKLRY